MPEIAQSPNATSAHVAASRTQSSRATNDRSSERASGPGRRRRRCLDGVDVLGHQSVFPMSPIAGAFVLKCCSNTSSAAGAAAVPPWPPFSMTAQTAIDGLSAGA